MGIISLFRADVDSRIEKRLTALESAIADLPAKISAAEKNVIWNLFEKDFDAIAKGSNAVVRELGDLPEKFAAYAKIYLKAALKEIDPEAVAAELDEAQGVLSAFVESAKEFSSGAGVNKDLQVIVPVDKLKSMESVIVKQSKLCEKYAPPENSVTAVQAEEYWGVSKARISAIACKYSVPRVYATILVPADRVHYDFDALSKALSREGIKSNNPVEQEGEDSE